MSHQLGATASGTSRFVSDPESLTEVVWTVQRLIEGFALWNAAAYVHGLVQWRRAATSEAQAAVGAKVASSPLPTLRPFGIPAIAGVAIATLFHMDNVNLLAHKRITF